MGLLNKSSYFAINFLFSFSFHNQYPQEQLSGNPKLVPIDQNWTKISILLRYIQFNAISYIKSHENTPSSIKNFYYCNKGTLSIKVLQNSRKNFNQKFPNIACTWQLQPLFYFVSYCEFLSLRIRSYVKLFSSPSVVTFNFLKKSHLETLNFHLRLRGLEILTQTQIFYDC